MQPGVHFLSIGAEWQSAEELSGRDLAFPVIGRTMTHLGRTTGHRIEHFQCRDQFSSGIHLDREPAIAHFVDQLGEVFCANAYTREVLRPGGDHLPVEFLGACGAFGLGSGFGFLVATGQCGCGQTNASGGQNLTTFHESLLVVVMLNVGTPKSGSSSYHMAISHSSAVTTYRHYVRSTAGCDTFAQPPRIAGRLAITIKDLPCRNMPLHCSVSPE